MSEFDVQPILATLPPDFQQPLAHEPLRGGQSLVHLYRLTYTWGTAILKGPLQAREAAFYREVAPQFAQRGIAVPQTLAWGGPDGEDWLVREDLPSLLPYGRWVADPAVITTLRQLHALPATFPIASPFVPEWQEIVVPQQTMVPAPTLAYIAQLRSCCAAISTPQCVIAGDPNPSNWGIRADGTVVLFDWDRVGYGMPAHDLAITVPSLGWPTIFRQLAAAYCAADPAIGDEAINQLAHDMAIIKLQTTIEYINMPEITEENRQFVLALFPSWVEMIWQMDVAYHAGL